MLENVVCHRANWLKSWRMPSGESTFVRNDRHSFSFIEGCTVVICDGFLVNSPISELAVNLLF